MFKHHQQTLNYITKKLAKKSSVLAVLVSGSIAHGFARPDSDLDLMILVTEAEYKRCKRDNNLQYYETVDFYQGGYIDGKYISPEFLKKVATQGSEPARFAFEGALISYSNFTNLEQLLQKIVSYPQAGKQDRIARFYAQFEAWKWYAEEALKHNNLYLLNYSITQFILFAGRLILTENEQLYPYHKWFLKVLADVKEKPTGLLSRIDLLLEEPDQQRINNFYQLIKDFRNWSKSADSWPNLFMQDRELNWLNGSVPVADL